MTNRARCLAGWLVLAVSSSVLIARAGAPEAPAGSAARTVMVGLLVDRDGASFTVSVFGTVEVSGAAGAPPLTLARSGPNVSLQFQDVSAAAYNVYVSNSATTSPFKVADPGDGKDCDVAATQAGAGLLQVADYDPDVGITGDRTQLFILVTADNGAGTEASLGTSTGAVRAADACCAP